MRFLGAGWLVLGFRQKDIPLSSCFTASIKRIKFVRRWDSGKTRFSATSSCRPELSDKPHPRIRN